MIANIFSAILFSIAANIDNIVIGIAYGVNKINIKISSNLLIAAITTIGTFIAMYIGKFLSHIISYNTANILGSSIIILLGIFFFIKSFIELNKTEEGNISKYALESDKDNSHYIDIKESIGVGLSLAINNARYTVL